MFGSGGGGASSARAETPVREKRTTIVEDDRPASRFASSDEDVGTGWSRSFSFVGTIVIVGFLLVFLRSILVPFVAALFLAYLVRPVADRISTCRCIPWFRRRHEAALARENGREEQEPLLGGDGPSLKKLETSSKLVVSRVETFLPRWMGVMLALLLAMTVIIGILAAMVVTITSFQSQMPRYRGNAQLIWQQLLTWVKTTFNVDLSELQAVPSRIFSNAAGTFLTTSVTLTTDLMLVMVFLAFILVQPPAQQSSLRKKIDDAISRYIILKSVISVGVALFVYVTLAAVAFPLALFVALATFVLNFIPSLGPTISTLLVVPIILLDTLEPYQSAIALLAPLVLHLLVGNILEPWLFGQQFSMNPVIILFSLGVWYILWGTIGAVLAVPLTSVLRILCNHLMEHNIGMPYIAAVATLLEGKSMDLNLVRLKPDGDSSADLENERGIRTEAPVDKKS